MRFQSMTSRTPQRHDAGNQGIALLEFALILPVLIIMAFGVIDFGRLIQTRLIISNVSREGGSVASRETAIDPNFLNLLITSAKPLDLAGGDGKIMITRIVAGVSEEKPSPTIQDFYSAGGLGRGSIIGADNLYLGLPMNLYNHLLFKPENKTSDISEITVVEVYYRYRPITPLPNFIEGILMPDNGGLIVGSRAIF